MREPLISIIVPMYNVENYICDCLESIAQQSYKNFELLLIDDESTDRSLETAKTYLDRIPEMHIHCQSNRGLGGARNTGINISKGEFITFVDSDDTITPDYLSSLQNRQAERDYDVVSGRLDQVTESGAYLPPKPKNLPDFEPSLDEHETVLGVYDLSVSCGRLYRTSFIRNENIKFPERSPHEDMFFTYKLLMLAKGRTSLIDKGIYKWRQREGSLSNSLTKSHIGVMATLRRDTNEFLSRHNGTPREYALSAKRNITLLNVFRGKVEKLNSSILDTYLSEVNVQKEDIAKDIDLLNKNNIKIGYNTPALLFEAEDHSPSESITANERLVDFAFLPMRGYHFHDCAPVVDLLRHAGLNVDVISTDHFRGGGA